MGGRLLRCLPRGIRERGEAVMTAFAKQLIAGAKREILSIAIRDPHREENQGVCRKPEGKIDALISAIRLPIRRIASRMSWRKSVSTPTLGRMAVLSEDDFETEFRSPMRWPHDERQAKNLRQLPFAAGWNGLCGRSFLISQQHLGLDRAFLVWHSPPPYPDLSGCLTF
jgi:hypothetical protein